MYFNWKKNEYQNNEYGNDMKWKDENTKLEFYLTKSYADNPNFLFDCGFGLCKGYCTDGDAYELFTDNLRIYYIPCFDNQLSVEIMHEDTDAYLEIVAFFADLLDLGILSTYDYGGCKKLNVRIA